MHLVQTKNTYLASLSLVCRTWRQIIIFSPLLWQRITVTSNGDTRHVQSLRKYVEISLDRSKAALLDIRIDFGSLVTPVEYFLDRMQGTFRELNLINMDRFWEDECPIEEEYCRLFRQLVESIVGVNGANMMRWRSLTLVLPDEGEYVGIIPFIWPTFACNAPHLVELIVQGGWQSLDDFQHLDKCFLNMTNLERLVLPDRFVLSSFDVEPKTIKHLIVFEIYDQSNILQFSSFSNLRTLRYSAPWIRTITPMGTSVATAVGKVRLPCLETLSLGGPHPAEILNLFDVPLLSTLYLLECFDYITPLPNVALFGKASDVHLSLSDSEDEVGLRGILPQFHRASSITIDHELLDELIEMIHLCRSERSNCLPALRKVYPGDGDCKRIGEPVDIPLPHVYQDSS